MWHIICLCLPAVVPGEQQRFFTLFKEVLRAYGREPGEMDLSLFFLYALAPEEALTVLEERLDLVVRSQGLLAEPRWVAATRLQRKDDRWLAVVSLCGTNSPHKLTVDIASVGQRTALVYCRANLYTTTK